MSTVDSHAAGQHPRTERSPPVEERATTPVYRRTVALLRRWATDEAGSVGTLREHHLRRYLWETLAGEGHAVTVTAPSGTDTPDIVVDGTIGIEILASLNQGATGWVRRELYTLCEGYDHLVVLGYGIDAEHTDRWRHLQSSVTPADVDLRDIAFVDTFDESHPGVDSGRLPVAPETAALLALATPMAVLGARVLLEFTASLETIGTGLVVAVVLTYFLGTALLAFALQYL